MKKKILIVDDENDICVTLSKILWDQGYDVTTAKNSSAALKEIKKNIIDLVLLDVWLEGSKKNGLELLKIIKNFNENMPVILISGHGNIEMAVNAIKKGAFYFIEKPFKSEKLFLLIERALENAYFKKEYEVLKNKVDDENEEIVGVSSYTNTLRKNIKKLSRTNARILISGEIGSGKKLIASVIHNNSNRSKKTFVTIHCSMLNNKSFEKDFFGNFVKEEKTLGFIQQADGGTIFLNEICDMPYDIQGKFTNFLQKETYSPEGIADKFNANVRIISSTSKNCLSEIENKRLRKDLFYRLNVAPLKVPPIKQRRDDIPILVDYFIKRIMRQNRVKELKLSNDVISILQTVTWSGNITQIKNFVDWLYIMYPNIINKGNSITTSLLPKELFEKDSTDKITNQNNQSLMNLPIKDARKEFEKNYLLNQVNRFSGNISKVANFIGMERSALHRKIKQIGVKK